jgi:hypothetical protein
LLLLIAHGRRRNLRRHAGFFQSRIRGHEAHFIHANAPGIRDCGFQLFGKFSGLCFSGGKRVDKSGEFSFRDLLCELHAR